MTRSLLLLGASVAAVAATPHIAAQNLGKSRQTAIVTAASRLAPAVVSVNVLRRERGLPQDPFEQFFTPAARAGGGGLWVRLHNLGGRRGHHEPAVTQGAEQIVVTTRDGRDFPATIQGEDPYRHRGAEADATGLTTAPLGKSTTS